MQAIIFAAGFGSRLSKPLNLKPKSLLKIKNKTIIYHMINKLINCKIIKITVVVGYQKKLLKTYLINNFKDKCNFNFINNKFYKSRGNIYSAYLLNNKIDNDVIILNSDLIFQEKTLIKFLDKKHKNLFLTNKKKDITNDDILFVHKKNKIVKKIYIKSKSDSRSLILPAAGIVKMSAISFRNYMKIISNKDLIKEKYYEAGYVELIKKNIFRVCVASQKIEEIDTARDYKKFIKTKYSKYL